MVARIPYITITSNNYHLRRYASPSTWERVMPNDSDEAFKSLLEFLHEKRKTGEVFSLYEVEKYVKANAGTLFLAPGRRVRDYIEELVAEGRLHKTGALEYGFGC